MSGLDELLLPPGGRLVHIGPHKTGTTAIQAAFHASRALIAAHGVHYAGETIQAYRPALALTGRPGQRGTGRIAADAWERLVAEVEGYGEDRVVMSSESFSSADAAAIERLQRDLGPERVHVVRMLRRYDTLLPSLWQQRVVAGYGRSWEQYAERILGNPGHKFWQRFGFASLTQRFVDVLGPERVTVVVVNERDHDWLLRVMRAMVGLPEDALTHGGTARDVNRSLTWAEADMLRRVNQDFNHRPWSDAALRYYTRFGVKAALKPFPADETEGRPRVPPDRLSALAEVTEQHWTALRDLGVRVVGERDWLQPAAAAATEPAGGERRVAVAKVVASTLSIVARSASESAPSLDPQGDVAPPPSGFAGTASPPAPVRPVPDLVGVQPVGEMVVAALTAAQIVAAPGGTSRSRRRNRVLLVVPPWQELLLRWQGTLLAGRRINPADFVPIIDGPGAPEEADAVVVASLERPVETAELLAGALGVPVPHDLAAPRALTAEELVLLRELNDSREWPHEDYSRYVTGGLVPWLRAARPAPAATLPAEVRPWAAGQAAAWRAWIDRTGAAVLGDLAWLDPPAEGDPRLPAELAGLALAGVISRLP
ncbi:hypothetical protein [Nocardioides sp.]|uniref:hypothetical protein n=1 Tax=Nocardioides sp. TaxID=35761 RepID=UPI002C517285|nr:hypothetical protein [Nocardioides sp.]HVX55441.1 hypothetical protein [Nocardioides sp.]